ncbi:MAG: hypothetical protein PUP92_17965 [Rhizonema sp. PD38]|nr:hypothetical protein [Rhizonema sp. PD38]
MNEMMRVLTKERILVVTQEILRRYGSAKTTVVDVARFLFVSHVTINLSRKAESSYAEGNKFLHVNARTVWATTREPRV